MATNIRVTIFSDIAPRVAH